ncbi:MAG: protein of unknown function YeeE/YedE [Firmicutes bacterium]|nr:protein of unknown function YeeE/YedE [Bacillota bacterium]
MIIKQDNGWSPYFAGALSGLLLVFSVGVAGKYFGASTTFVRTTGMVEKIFGADRVAHMPYFIKEAPIIDWQWMFVIGIFIGSLIAATLFGSFCWKSLPNTWIEHFGENKTLRAVTAFLGGIIAMFGARLADGCPSGHGISGSLQLAVSGFIALICFFIGGMIVVRILYRGGDQS